QTVARFSRVSLHGEGPDNALLYEWEPYLSYLWKKKRFGRLLRDTLVHSVSHWRVPLFPSIIKIIRSKMRESSSGSQYAPWLNPEFESRLNLRARWIYLHKNTLKHPVRPRGYQSFALPQWQGGFEELDSAYTRVPMDVRHPFLDTRFVRFLLAVP